MDRCEKITKIRAELTKIGTKSKKLYFKKIKQLHY